MFTRHRSPTWAASALLTACHLASARMDLPFHFHGARSLVTQPGSSPRRVMQAPTVSHDDGRADRPRTHVPHCTPTRLSHAAVHHRPQPGMIADSVRTERTFARCPPWFPVSSGTSMARASVACEPQATAWGGHALFKHRCEVVHCGELTLISAALPQMLDLLKNDCGLLLVHERIPVRVDGSEPTGYSEELERAERIGQRVAVPVGAPKERCAGLPPVAGRPRRVQFQINAHAP
ncbi:hypothetical protein BJY54_002414 [Streptomyces nodosus]|nr:hypothetical protein [Streptomyces nodosus]